MITEALARVERNRGWALRGREISARRGTALGQLACPRPPTLNIELPSGGRSRSVLPESYKGEQADSR